MENVVFTQLSISEIRNLLRQELKDFFETQISKRESQQPTDTLLTVPQAANFLSLSVPTIYTKVSKNELPFMKRGKRVYFTESELLDYLKKGRIKTNEEVNREAQNYISSNNGKKKGVTNE